MIIELPKCLICNSDITDGQSVYCCDACFRNDQLKYSTFRPQGIKEIVRPVDLNSVIGRPIAVEKP